MVRTKLLGLAAAVTAMGVLAFGASAEDEDTPKSISEIMVAAHKGKTSLLKKIGGSLKGGEKPTEDVKELIKLAKDLTKNTPDKGSEDSWDELSGGYLENAEALHKALEEDEGAKANASYRKLSSSCMGCHTAHR